MHDADVRQGGLGERFDAILLPVQEPKDLVDGNPEKNQYKEPYPAGVRRRAWARSACAPSRTLWMAAEP